MNIKIVLCKIKCFKLPAPAKWKPFGSGVQEASRCKRRPGSVVVQISDSGKHIRGEGKIMLVISRAKDDERKEGPELAFSESAPPGFSNKVSDFKEEHSQLRSSWLVSWRKFFIHEGSC